MQYTVGLVEDKDMALEMAYAENPYRELGILAASLGLTQIVAQVEGHAKTAARTAEKEYKQNIKDITLQELISTSNTPVVTLEEFSTLSPYGGRVWGKLRRTVANDPDIPLEFVNLIDDEYVLRGDFKTASWGLRNSVAGIVLGKLAEIQTTELY